jgi:hypothetical protein
MSLFRFSVGVWVSMAVMLGACEKSSQQKVVKIYTPKLSALTRIEKDPQQLKFRFHETRKRCLTTAGIPGRNLGVVGECGEVTKAEVIGQDLTSISLKGFFAHESDFSGSDFSKANLDSAVLLDSVFEDAKFQGTVLFDVTIRTQEIAKIFDVSVLKDAVVNADSEFPYDLKNPARFSVDELKKVGVNFSGLLMMPASSVLRGIYLDESQLSATERELIGHDFARMEALALEPEKDSFFSQAFGNKSQLIHYLAQRVKYVGGVSNQTVASTVAFNPSIHFFLADYEKQLSGPLYAAYDIVTKLLTQVDPFTSQRNQNDQSAIRDLVRSEGVDILVNGKKLPTTSPNVGTVYLGPLYVGSRLKSLERVGTWVHEARHSDCSDSDASFKNNLEGRWKRLEAIRKELVEQEQKLKDPFSLDEETRAEWLSLLSQQKLKLHQEISEFQNFIREPTFSAKQCWHLHAKCADNHPDLTLRGLSACDDQSWGAYSVGAAYWDGISSSCTNCSESEKQLAVISMMDSLNRLNDLNDLRNTKIDGLGREIQMKELDLR